MNNIDKYKEFISSQVKEESRVISEEKSPLLIQVVVELDVKDLRKLKDFQFSATAVNPYNSGPSVSFFYKMRDGKRTHYRDNAYTFEDTNDFAGDKEFEAFVTELNRMIGMEKKVLDLYFKLVTNLSLVDATDPIKYKNIVEDLTNKAFKGYGPISTLVQDTERKSIYKNPAGETVYKK